MPFLSSRAKVILNAGVALGLSVYHLLSIAVADYADQAAASPRPLPSSLSWINYKWITLKIQSVDARVFDHYRLWDYADCLWRNGLRLPAWVLRFR